MFKNLDAFKVSASSRTELDMSPYLGENAVLQLAPATGANPNFQNAFMKMTAKVRKDLARDKVDAESLDMIRDIQRELYGRFVIVGWSGVEGEPGGEGVDDDGMVPYSRGNAQKLCRALPNELFDMLTVKAGNSESFYPEDEVLPPTPEELDELAGN